MNFDDQNNFRVLDSDVKVEEIKQEVLLRPVDFSEYIGEEILPKIKDNNINLNFIWLPKLILEKYYQIQNMTLKI